MDKINDLLPKNKFDNSNMEKIRDIPNNEIEPLLPELLTWLQDANWPIFKDVLELLVNRQKPLIPLIINILKPEQRDDVWKYYIISALLPLFSDKNLEILLPFIKRIAETPTETEKIEEVDQAAINLLKSRFNNVYQLT